MGRSGMDLCKEHGLSWIDLSGNAHIKAPRLLIHIEGRPNKFKKVDRPANVLHLKVPESIVIHPFSYECYRIGCAVFLTETAA